MTAQTVTSLFSPLGQRGNPILQYCIIIIIIIAEIRTICFTPRSTSDTNTKRTASYQENLTSCNYKADSTKELVSGFGNEKRDSSIRMLN